MWFCGQRNGTLNRLDPRDGSIRVVNLGQGAAPHGVIRGPDGAAWVTEGGQNAIARVDAEGPPGRGSGGCRSASPMPTSTPASSTRAAASGSPARAASIGRFDPRTERMEVWEAPRGRGAYGITPHAAGRRSGTSRSPATTWRRSRSWRPVASAIVEPPTPNQGARRVWSDSTGRLWISEWNSGNVSIHDPRDGSWKAWKLPGQRPRAYSVWVDPSDKVWLTDFAANAIVRFDPKDASFLAFPSDRPGAKVRQMDGVAGEAWGGESGTDRIIRIQYGQ